jgi:putative Mg2+ transporter-C (MgtC) family protein
MYSGRELTSGLPDARQLVHVLIRMIAATILERSSGDNERKPETCRAAHAYAGEFGHGGVRPRLLGVGMSPDGVSRVVQGIITGIGFLGAGSILKLDREREIQGLTTAAGIWMTAAIGVAVGLGSLGVALLSTVFTLVILSLSELLDRDQETQND